MVETLNVVFSATQDPHKEYENVLTTEIAFGLINYFKAWFTFTIFERAPAKRYVITTKVSYSTRSCSEKVQWTKVENSQLSGPDKICVL